MSQGRTLEQRQQTTYHPELARELPILSVEQRQQTTYQNDYELTRERFSPWNSAEQRQQDYALTRDYEAYRNEATRDFFPSVVGNEHEDVTMSLPESTMRTGPKTFPAACKAKVNHAATASSSLHVPMTTTAVKKVPAPCKPKRNSDEYEYEFMDTPPEDIHCPICLLVLQEPYLTSCCGNHFCKKCIERVKGSWQPCPLCKSSNFTIMLDKFFKRKINELKVKCPNSDEGCEWSGELGDAQKHISPLGGSCCFVEVSCDYRCGSQVVRRDLKEHKANVCTQRPFSCTYCRYRSTYEDITERHWLECKVYPLHCPNQCGAKEMKRKCLEKHLKVECPLAVVECDFHFAGCDARISRKDMTKHISENMASHLLMMPKVCLGFREQLSEKDQKIAALETTVEQQEWAIAELRHSVSRMSASQISSTDDKADNDQYYTEIFGLLKRIAMEHPGLSVSKTIQTKDTQTAVKAGVGAGAVAGSFLGPLGVIAGAVGGALLGYQSSVFVHSPFEVLKGMNKIEQRSTAAAALVVARRLGLTIDIRLPSRKAVLSSPWNEGTLLTRVLEELNFSVKEQRQSHSTRSIQGCTNEGSFWKYYNQ